MFDDFFKSVQICFSLNVGWKVYFCYLCSDNYFLPSIFTACIWYHSGEICSHCVLIFQLGVALRRYCHFAISSELGSMSLCHHNITKNPSHDLTLLPLSQYWRFHKHMAKSVKLWQLCIKAWKDKWIVNNTSGEDEFIDGFSFYHTIYQLDICIACDVMAYTFGTVSLCEAVITVLWFLLLIFDLLLTDVLSSGPVDENETKRKVQYRLSVYKKEHTIIFMQMSSTQDTNLHRIYNYKQNRSVIHRIMLSAKFPRKVKLLTS